MPLVPGAPGGGRLPRRRQWSFLALGVALLAAAFVMINALVDEASQTRQVLAVTHVVERGQIIEASDLTTAAVPAGESKLATVPASRLDQVTGQVATMSLAPGMTLPAEATATSLVPEEGYSIVGVNLSANQRPSTGLHAGDAVRIVHAPADGASTSEDAGEVMSAQVVATTPGEQAGQVIVDVQVTTEQAPTLAAWALAGDVVLILDAPAE